MCSALDVRESEWGSGMGWKEEEEGEEDVVERGGRGSWKRGGGRGTHFLCQDGIRARLAPLST